MALVRRKRKRLARCDYKTVRDKMMRGYVAVQQSHYEQGLPGYASQDALAKSRAFLYEHLTPSQRRTFTSNGTFIVDTGRTKYRLSTRRESNIVVVEASDRSPKTQYGSKLRVGHYLCIIAPPCLPQYDQMLGQKLALEDDEDFFVTISPG